MFEETIASIDVYKIIKPRIENYNYQCIDCLQKLSRLCPSDSAVFFESPIYHRSIEELVLLKQSYAASFVVYSQKLKPLKIQFPFLVMFGSRLDFILRILKLKYVSPELLLNTKYGISAFEMLFTEDYTKFDIYKRVYTCFLIGGILRQVPHFISNNPVNFHITKDEKVKKYVYDSNGKGTKIEYSPKQMSVSLSDSKGNTIECQPLCFKASLKRDRSHLNCDQCTLYHSEIVRLHPVYASLDICYAVSCFNCYLFIISKTQHKEDIDQLGNKLCIEIGEFLNMIITKDLHPLLHLWKSNNFKTFHVQHSKDHFQ